MRLYIRISYRDVGMNNAIESALVMSCMVMMLVILEGLV